MRLIPEIREAWKYSSVRISAVITLASAYWVGLEKAEQLKLLDILHITPAHLPLAVALLTLAARLTTFRKP